ncbi:MAG: hypothetical protein ACR2PU_02650 [Gammaproteobacteria bacterium]
MDLEKMGQETSQDESKRKFLKTAGKFAIYTPPALLIMSKANATKSHMYKSVKPNGDGKKHKHYGKKRYYRKRKGTGRRRRVSIFRRYFSK